MRLLVIVSLLLLAVESAAWIETSSARRALTPLQTPVSFSCKQRVTATSVTSRRTSAIRLAKDDNGDTPNSYKSFRADFSGVSVSPTGFWVLLRCAQDRYVPVQVTDSVQDAASATSPQALTLLQLLDAIDMAGAILPPDTLARIVMGVCDSTVDIDTAASAAAESSSSTDETNANDNNGDNTIKALEIRKSVRESKSWPKQAQEDSSYLELQDWSQSKIRLPTSTLDQIECRCVEPTDSDDSTLSSRSLQWKYTCQVKNFGSFSLTPTANILQRVAWSDPAAEQDENDDTAAATGDDDDAGSAQAAFFALALALRYQAPVLLSVPDIDIANDTAAAAEGIFWTLEKVQQEFPLFRSRDKLQETSNKVVVNIERGFEIHKLQAALKIAIQKNDQKAAARIRDRLDEMDSLADLPVQPDTDTQSMQ